MPSNAWSTTQPGVHPERKGLDPRTGALMQSESREIHCRDQRSKSSIAAIKHALDQRQVVKPAGHGLESQ